MRNPDEKGVSLPQSGTVAPWKEAKKKDSWLAEEKSRNSSD